jgi:hypothetical protein
MSGHYAEPLDPKAVDYALRKVISLLDYDLHKSLEHDEETGEDTYGEEVATFTAAYEAYMEEREDGIS